MSHPKITKANKTTKINSLLVGSKVYASLATWYKRNEWGKTKYGTATSLKQRYLEGVVQDITYRKSGAPLYLIKFSALESKGKFWFTKEKLLANVLYVVSEFHLPKSAIVVHNLEVDLNVAVKRPKLDLVRKSNAPKTMAALVAENNQLHQKLTEASAVIYSELCSYSLENQFPGRKDAVSVPVGFWHIQLLKYACYIY